MNLIELSNNVAALIKAGKLPKKFEITEASLKEKKLEVAFGTVGKHIYMWDAHGRAHVSHGTQLGIIEAEDGSATVAEIYAFQRLPEMDFNSR